MSKHSNYAQPVSANGRTKYFALECGHLVSEPTTKLCKKCQKEKWASKYPNFLRWDNGEAIYSALECGHEVNSPAIKNCKPCIKKDNYISYNHKTNKCTYAATECGHPVSKPFYKLCWKCRNGERKREINKDSNTFVKTWGHRIAAEKVLGRKLKRDEVVHHINGDKSDNRNCNLLICDRSYHQYLHARMSLLYAKEKFGSI